jgi:hypothetical protein
MREREGRAYEMKIRSADAGGLDANTHTVALGPRYVLDLDLAGVAADCLHEKRYTS